MSFFYSNVEIIMPNIGESILEVKVINWTKKEGDFIFENDSILEVSTDKINIEIPSLYTGVMIKKMFIKNQVIKIGSILGIISVLKKFFFIKKKTTKFFLIILFF